MSEQSSQKWLSTGNMNYTNSLAPNLGVRLSLQYTAPGRVQDVNPLDVPWWATWGEVGEGGLTARCLDILANTLFQCESVLQRLP